MAEGHTWMFSHTARHSDMLYHNGRLFMIWSEIGEAPEHIKATEIMVTPDWKDWKRGETESILLPFGEDEGENLPLTKSVLGEASTRVRQLR